MEMKAPRFFQGKRGLILTALTLASAMSISAFLGSSALNAQEETSGIKSMYISVWPEYDAPDILVMYEGEFADATPLPQEVQFLVPKGAEISQVCAITKPNNEHLCQPYQLGEEGDSTTITYTLPIPNFYLEYYYDGLGGENERAFTYQFQSRYPIERLVVEVQQPLRSSNFSLSPANATIRSGSQGFKYYQYSFDNVAPGQVIDIEASYRKPDARPSVANNQQGGSGDSSLPIILGAMGAALAAVVGWFVLFRRRRPARRVAVAVKPGKRVRPLPQSRQDLPPQQRARRAYFCPNCGAQLDGEPNFCPECGTKMRKGG